MTRRSFLKTAIKLTAGAGIAISGGTGYAYGLEPSWVDLHRQTLTLSRLQAAFHNYRITQISDLHTGGWLKRDHLQDVVSRVNAESPDLIVITGDFVGGDPYDVAADLVDTVSQLSAPDGVLYVLGNHDHWSGPEHVRAMLGDIGITELRNEVLPIERTGAALQIAGVDDHWEGQDRLDLVQRQLATSAPAILLAHEPDFADISAATGRFALQLSGHSHGGQISPPLLGPPLLPPFGQRYPRGRYMVGGMVQYTNRGVGMLRPYGRLNCRPEITVITLRASV